VDSSRHCRKHGCLRGLLAAASLETPAIGLPSRNCSQKHSWSL
jgi:hypothetical protein